MATAPWEHLKTARLEGWRWLRLVAAAAGICLVNGPLRAAFGEISTTEFVSEAFGIVAGIGIQRLLFHDRFYVSKLLRRAMAWRANEARMYGIRLPPQVDFGSLADRLGNNFWFRVVMAVVVLVAFGFALRVLEGRGDVSIWGLAYAAAFAAAMTPGRLWVPVVISITPLCGSIAAARDPGWKSFLLLAVVLGEGLGFALLQARLREIAEYVEDQASALKAKFATRPVQICLSTFLAAALAFWLTPDDRPMTVKKPRSWVLPRVGGRDRPAKAEQGAAREAAKRQSEGNGQVGSRSDAGRGGKRRGGRDAGSGRAGGEGGSSVRWGEGDGQSDGGGDSQEYAETSGVDAASQGAGGDGRASGGADPRGGREGGRREGRAGEGGAGKGAGREGGASETAGREGGGSENAGRETGRGGGKEQPGHAGADASGGRESGGGASQNQTGAGRSDGESKDVQRDERTRLTLPKFELPNLPKIDEKLILRLVVTLAFLAVLAGVFYLLTRRREKERPGKDGREPEAVSTRALTPQEFEDACRQALHGDLRTGEDLRQMVVRLYNVLLEFHARCGVPREPNTTPDEFALKSRSAVPARAKEMAYVTEVFCRSHYGKVAPTPADARTFVQCVARIGAQLRPRQALNSPSGP